MTETPTQNVEAANAAALKQDKQRWGDTLKAAGTMYPHEEQMQRALNYVPTKVLPTHARTFVETVRGDSTPITEKNFSRPERNAIRDAINNAQNRPEPIPGQRGNTSTRGYVTYPDYQSSVDRYHADKARYGESAHPYGAISPEDMDRGLVSSLTMPPDSVVAHTLGGFSYERPFDDQPYTVRDAYDFMGMGYEDNKIKNWKDAIRQPYGAMQQLGSKIANPGTLQDGWGRRVQAFQSGYEPRQVNLTIDPEYEVEYARDKNTIDPTIRAAASLGGAPGAGLNALFNYWTPFK